MRPEAWRTFAQLVGEGLIKKWNVAAVVANRVGVGRNLAADFVGSASTDGSPMLD